MSHYLPGAEVLGMITESLGCYKTSNVDT